MDHLSLTCEAFEVKKYAANEDDDEPAINSTAEHEAPAGQPDILPADAEGMDFSSAAAAASSHKRPGQQAESSPSKKLRGDEAAPPDGMDAFLLDDTKFGTRVSKRHVL